MAPTRVLLITLPMFAHYVQTVLRRSSAGVEIIGVTDNTTEALLLISTCRPHLLIVDICAQSPIAGFEIMLNIRQVYPHALTIGYTDQTDQTNKAAILQAVQAGVTGFIAAGADQPEISAAIAAVRRGNAYLPQQIAQQFVREFQAEPPQRLGVPQRLGRAGK
jgi:DNA-binding NarL/FixJ family response regulator